MSERPVFIVEDFLLVSQTKATVTLCGPLSVVQKLCPIGALVELREAPSDHPTSTGPENVAVEFATHGERTVRGSAVIMHMDHAPLEWWNEYSGGDP